MNINKINSLIQFANKANKISYKQTLNHFINKGKIGLILIASDASSNTLDKIDLKTVTHLNYLTKNELGDLLNKSEISIIGILDKNIAKEIKRLILEEDKIYGKK